MNDEDLHKIDLLLNQLLPASGLKLTHIATLRPPGSIPALEVEFKGLDVPVLLARHAELLLALEHLAVQSLRLESDEHDQISFDAAGFKANRTRNLHRAAESAVQRVRVSGEAFHFAPMSSRERRLLHLALAPSGLPTESEGDGPMRHLVLRPL
jgi:spoIIIJ-associated protein